jgi:hypothetical protein
MVGQTSRLFTLLQHFQEIPAELLQEFMLTTSPLILRLLTVILSMEQPNTRSAISPVIIHIITIIPSQACLFISRTYSPVPLTTVLFPLTVRHMVGQTFRLFTLLQHFQEIPAELLQEFMLITSPLILRLLTVILSMEQPNIRSAISPVIIHIITIIPSQACLFILQIYSQVPLTTALFPHTVRHTVGQHSLPFTLLQHFQEPPAAHPQEFIIQTSHLHLLR